MILVETLEANNFIHYELSNFGKENFFSKNNSAYWLGKKYIAWHRAHSYDGVSRSWNIANNTLYIKHLTLMNYQTKLKYYQRQIVLTNIS
jgi:oxygen-independent coproporphyrinogen-3 oxidase